MRICICDDKMEDLDMLNGICREYLKRRDISAEIVCTQEPEVPLEGDFDLLFLDVEMPKMRGPEIKQRLTGRERPYIIFVTSYQETIREAFGINVLGFLNKPVERTLFEAQMDLAVNLLGAGRLVHLGRGRWESSKDIMMFFTEDKYTKALLADGRRTESSEKSLASWEKELSDQFFLRVDTSYLVNCKYIQDLSDNEVILSNGQTVKMSRRRKKEILAKFCEYSRRFGRFA